MREGYRLVDGNKPSQSYLCSPVGERIVSVIKLYGGSFHVMPLIDRLGGPKGQALQGYESVHEACADLSERYYNLTTPRSERLPEQLNFFSETQSGLGCLAQS